MPKTAQLNRKELPKGQPWGSALKEPTLKIGDLAYHKIK
jgi:hypothetical protein